LASTRRVQRTNLLPPCARWLVAVVVVAAVVVVVDRSASPGKWSGFWVGLLEGMAGGWRG
jgi:hypothetical protein